MLHNCLLRSMGTTVKLTRCTDAPRTKVDDTLNSNPCLSREGYYNGGEEWMGGDVDDVKALMTQHRN